jgi:hypothetical protein
MGEKKFQELVHSNDQILLSKNDKDSFCWQWSMYLDWPCWWLPPWRQLLSLAHDLWLYPAGGSSLWRKVNKP